MNDAIGLKIGETLQLDIAFANDDGSPVNLLEYIIFAQVRDLNGNLVGTPGINVSSAATNVAVISEATDFWPSGTLFMDLKLTTLGSNVVTFSETVSLRMSNPISQGGPS